MWTTADVFIAIVFIAFIVWYGLRHGKSNDSRSYFLANRSMPWWIVGLSLFAASISTTTLIGQSGDAYTTGIAVYNYNLVGVVVMIFFAIFLFPLYMRSGIFTIPEFLEKRFDKRSRYYFSAICIIGNIFLDAAGALYAGALIIKLIYPPADMQLVIWLFAILVASYTIPGGLTAVIKTEFIQAIVLIISPCLLAWFCYRNGGTALQELFRSGDHLVKLIRPVSDSSTPWPGLILGMPVLGIYFWANNQTMVQRVLSARSVNEGRLGLLLTGLLSIVVMLLITFSGTMARSIFPGLENPDIIYPTMVMKLLPGALLFIVLLVLLSALMSALGAILNSTATLFTIDFYSRLNKNATSSKQVMVGKYTSLTVVILAALWAPQIGKFGSLLKYYQEMLSYLSPPVVAIFLLGIFNKRVNGRGAFTGLMAGSIVAVLLLFYKPVIFGNLHFLLVVPFVLLFSMLIVYLSSLTSPAPGKEQLENLHFSFAGFREELQELKQGNWCRHYLFWSALLLLTVACIWVLLG